MSGHAFYGHCEDCTPNTTQHDCSRIGCTRLTSEQECDLHAAEPSGVIHEPKEPRPPEPPSAQIIDLMEALRAALAASDRRKP